MALRSVRFQGRPLLEQTFSGAFRFSEGASGDDVRILQQAFIDRGYAISGAELGQFGPQTARAVSQFKTDEGLTPNDPVIGPRTMRRLDDYFAAEDSTDQSPIGGQSAASASFKIQGANDSDAVWLTSAEDNPIWRTNLGAPADVAAIWIEWLATNGYLPRP